MPESYYSYFLTVNRVPNKILYIDYGRDKKTSIENDGWKFSNFVKANYEKKHTFQNDLFGVEEYVLVDRDNAFLMMDSYFKNGELNREAGQEGA